MNKSDDDFTTHATTPRAPQVGAKYEVEMYQRLYTLAEFLNTFDLPQTVRVTEGCHGTTEASTISEGTVLLMCCRKTTKMLLTVDTHKVTHSIPCDSTSMYVAVDTVYGLEGHMYNNVNELVSCSDLPKVVYIDAKTASDLCLHDSDQLIFPYQKEQDLLGRNCLVCYDQRDTKFKFPAAKQGLFSTKPDDIKMGILSCVKHIRGFPYLVAKYDTDGRMFPTMDSGSILMLTGTSNKQSIMAKIMSGTGKDIDTEIPVNAPIKVQCLQTDSSQPSGSGASSGYLDVDKFQDHPYRADTGQYMTLMNSTHTTAEPLYEHLTGEGQTHGHLQTFPRQSPRLHEQFPTPLQRMHTTYINSAQPQIHTSRDAMMGSNNTYTAITSPDEYNDVINQPVTYDWSQQQLERIQKLEESNKKLHTEVAQLQACVNELVHLVVTKNPENNISQLSSMDTDTVLTMLRAMGLSEYEHIFREKEINGKKLTNLNRKKLSQYGITDVKDQEGLEDLIKGRVSPLIYLLRLPSSNTAESYARFTKPFRKLNHYY